MNVNIDEKEKFKLPENEMAFRKIYKELLEDESLTTVFRPGKRVCGDFRGYCVGDIVYAKVIDQIGLDRAYIAPEFLEEPVKKIRIDSIEALRIGSLTEEDFRGTSPDVCDKESLIYHIGLIYNLDKSSLTDDSEITQIKFTYIKQ